MLALVVLLIVDAFKQKVGLDQNMSGPHAIVMGGCKIKIIVLL